MEFDLGPNITQILLAFVAIVPAIIAAYYARKANITSETTQTKVDGFTHELVDAKEAKAAAEGQLAGEAAERERKLLAAVTPDTFANGSTIERSDADDA